MVNNFVVFSKIHPTGRQLNKRKTKEVKESDIKKQGFVDVAKTLAEVSNDDLGVHLYLYRFCHFMYYCCVSLPL